MSKGGGIKTRLMPTRRQFAVGLGIAAAGGLRVSASAASIPPPETKTVRLPQTGSICTAPQHVVDELLRAEGFSDIRHVMVDAGGSVAEWIAQGVIDAGLNYAPLHVVGIDRGLPVKVLAGAHVGCFEVFVHDAVQSVADLKGKTVGVVALGSPEHLFLSVIAANVGIDPRSEISWVTTGKTRPKVLFIDGKIDAFLGFPPEPQELRAKRIGRVIVDSGLDRPWSEYFCCMLAASSDYVRNYPVATKRVVRAILKATDLCANDPDGVARQLVAGGFTPRYDYADEALREIPYDKWRDYDAEDTMRFYALRLHELGMIKTDPKRIIAAGTDWRFLDEVKRELKA